MLPSFIALLYRLLQKISSSISLCKRNKRITQRNSGQRSGFLLNHRDRAAQSNTEIGLCVKSRLYPSLRGTKQSVPYDESKSKEAKLDSAFINRQSQIQNRKSVTVIPNFSFLISNLFACLIFFSSCEKVINVNLKEADKQIVIEGNISYNADLYPEVRISRTKSFEDDNTFNGVSGATVTVQVNNGTIYNLTEIETGIYNSTRFSGKLDSTYTLTVHLNGDTYTSVSKMPVQMVTLDSLWAEGLVFGGSTNITIYPKYTDPKGVGNYYRLVEYVNDTLVRKAFPQNDEFSDGNTVTRPLINPDSKIKEGDSITVELQCIDAAVYKYWYSLDAAATGNNQSATPTNPVTNISGGALGYFSAYTASRYSFTLL